MGRDIYSPRSKMLFFGYAPAIGEFPHRSYRTDAQYGIQVLSDLQVISHHILQTELIMVSIVSKS